MGTFRLLLALSVVIAHAGPFLGMTLVGSVPAVQAFFVISGFYMAMILTERYPAGRTMLFYSNRFLRIYPLYWAILATTVAVFSLVFLLPGVHHNALATLIAEGANIAPLRLATIIFSNVALVGLDVGLFFPVNLAAGGILNAGDLYLVPQAWTLGIEVVVYALAPLLFRRSAWLIAVVAAISLGARAICYQRGLADDPWDYRFSPFEIAFFCLGALAYKVTPAAVRHSRVLGVASVALLGALLLCFPALPDGPSIVPGFKTAQLVFLVATIASLGPLFELTKKLRWDRAIGELSYPLYLGHLLVIDLLVTHPGPWNLFTVLGSLAFAWVLARAVAPLERFRQRRAGSLGVVEASEAVAAPAT